MKYSVDTSALLDGWRRYYPPDVFPPVWQKLHRLVENRILVASEEVLFELKKKDDDGYSFAFVVRLGRLWEYVEVIFVSLACFLGSREIVWAK